MRYSFCNLTGEDFLLRGTNKGVSAVDMSMSSGPVVPTSAYIEDRNHDGKKTLCFAPEGSRLEKNEFDFIGNLSNEKTGYKLEDLVPTDDNPLVVVATKGFKIPVNIKVYLKYFVVGDYVIVALLRGLIQVEDEDGNFIDLCRNYNGTPSGMIDLPVSELKTLNCLTDDESGVAYDKYVVSDCLLHYTYSKDGRLMSSARFFKENFSFLDTEVFEKNKEKKAEADAKRRADAEARRAHFSEATEALRTGGEGNTPLYKANKEKAEKSSTRKPREKKVVEKKNGRSNDAMSFLQAVARAQSN